MIRVEPDRASSDAASTCGVARALWALVRPRGDARLVRPRVDLDGRLDRMGRGSSHGACFEPGPSSHVPREGEVAGRQSGGLTVDSCFETRSCRSGEQALRRWLEAQVETST